MSKTSASLNALLETLLQNGKSLAEKGQQEVETRLRIPESGVEREAMIDGLKKGAIASAVLLGLLGTKSGRSLTGSALKIGGLAALGAAAYRGYQNWKTDNAENAFGVNKSQTDLVHESKVDSTDQRSMLIINALVAAANADGHVDENEVRILRHELIEMHLGEDLASRVEEVLDNPLSVNDLADLVGNQQQAAEVYLASRLIIDENSSNQERGYLNDLTSELGISPEFRAHLEQQIS